MSPASRTDNPFSPGYGQPPPYLAGRDELINSTIEALRRGPGRGDYHRLLIGPRGTGKTAVMNVITGHAASEHGAVVLRWTAGSRPLDEAVDAGHADAIKRLRGRWRRVGPVDASATIGVPGVASATASRRQHRQPRAGTFTQLDELARVAARQHRSVIIWIDEAHSASDDEIRTLASVMQELANVQQLPISLEAAGLPETRNRWINAASFLERQPFTTLGRLDDSDTAAAIEIPVREHGRQIDLDAVELLVAASKGHPYTVQLMAFNAWEAADGHTIDWAAAQRGVDQGVAVLREQLFIGRWRLLTPSQRRYAHAAAAVEDRRTGDISSAAIARHLGTTTKALSKQRDELIRTHQLLVDDGRDRLSFGQPGLGAWIREQGSEPHRS